MLCEIMWKEVENISPTTAKATECWNSEIQYAKNILALTDRKSLLKPKWLFKVLQFPKCHGTWKHYSYPNKHCTNVFKCTFQPKSTITYSLKEKFWRIFSLLLYLQSGKLDEKVAENIIMHYNITHATIFHVFWSNTISFYYEMLQFLLYSLRIMLDSYAHLSLSLYERKFRKYICCLLFF